MVYSLYYHKPPIYLAVTLKGNEQPRDVHVGKPDEVDSSSPCQLPPPVMVCSRAVSVQFWNILQVSTFTFHGVAYTSILWLILVSFHATHWWWPFCAARCIGVFPSTFLMLLSTLCSIRTAIADRSFSLAVTCSTQFFWLSVDLTNLDPQLESAIRNCWKTDCGISITKSC